MKNVLIIGSTGQIGSELTMKLRRMLPEGTIVAGYIPGAEPKGELLESGPSAVVDVTNGAQIAEAVEILCEVLGEVAPLGVVAGQENGLSLENIGVILKVGIVLLFIAWFQLFAINSYSLLLVALLIVIWLDSMLGRKEAAPTTLSEINRKFIADLKQNIQDAKKLFNHDNKDEK